MGRAARAKQNPDRYQLEKAARQKRFRSTRPWDDMLLATAVHEAGHVIAAVVLGFGVRYAIVRVSETQRSVGGYTEIAIPLSGDSPDQAEAAACTPDMLRIRAIQAAAGPAAESMLQSCDHDDLESGASNDDDFIIGCALASLFTERPNPSDPEAQQAVNRYFHERHTDAVRLLADYTDTLSQIANHLLANLNAEVPGDVLTPIVRAD